jgi:ATP-dependent RNA helicase DeaD
VGAIDIHQRHTLVDVKAEQAAFVVQKLKGIKVKGVPLDPALATPENTK